MRLLLDTHALIWAVDDPSKLGHEAVRSLQDLSNELLLSAATVWELSIKVGLGKLRLSLPFLEWTNRAVGDLGVTMLPITIEHADSQSRLPGRGDPFDRLLVAQSQVEQLVIVSGDAGLDQYHVRRLW